MSNRTKTPCFECRKRRRKCVWHRYSLVCQRCAQRDIECVPIDDHNSSQADDDDARSEDGDQDLQQWISDIMQLQHTAQQLESTLDRIRSDIIDPSWTFHIVNDQLRLESGNVNLYQYGDACFRYLSPFAALFHKEPVTFECAALHHLLEGFRLVSQLKLEHSTPASMTPPLLTEPCIDFEKMMDTLVHFYIHDHPPQVLPILHIPSYYRHYKSLRDKMTCPITLAICVNAASSPMLPMKGYTAKERRAIGDFFFHRCHEILFDIFDDPGRRLDVLTTISLLYHYVSVVRLWFTEARRLATIALCICDDIQRSDLELLTPIQHALFQRQHLQSRYVMHFLDLVMHQAYKNEDLFNMEPFAIELEILEGESNTVEWNIKTINHLSRLCLSPYFLLIMNQLRSIICNRHAELNLHVFLRFEAVIREWWKSLPDELRVCDDPYSPDALDGIKRDTNITALLVLHTITALVHASILKPQIRSSTEGDFLHAMRQRALTMTMRSLDVITRASLASYEHAFAYSEILAFGIMGHMMYAMACIQEYPEVQMSSQSKLRFSTIFKGFSSFLPSDHRMPSSISPMASAITLHHASPTMCLYNDYPMPGYALISDTLAVSFDRLQSLLTLFSNGPSNKV